MTLVVALFCVAIRAGAEGQGGGTAGIVHLEQYSFSDDSGPFLGLGASYFLALRDAKYNPVRLEENLRFLVSKGFNCVRVLTMVGWEGMEIAPVTFTNRLGRRVDAWPDYWTRFRGLLDMAGRAGMRLELTVFADAQHVMPLQAVRQAHLDDLLANIAGLESKLVHLEIANEAWQNGFPGPEGVAQLRAFTKYLAEHTPVLVAITSNDDTTGPGIMSLYRGSAAGLATVHFSRNTREPEGGWLPVRDSYRAGRLPGVPPVTSNEPIGPGSSVGSEQDPIKLCSAAVVAYLSGLPGYVFHSRAGIYGYEKCCPPAGGELSFEGTPGIDAFGQLRKLLPRDVASWNPNNGVEAGAPFTAYCDLRPNCFWPDRPGSTNGCVANIGSSKGKEFVVSPIGILPGGVTIEARSRLRFEVLHPITGVTVTNLSLKARESFKLLQGPGAWIIRGAYLDSEPSEQGAATPPKNGAAAR